MRVVVTTGCFDCGIHAGHLKHLIQSSHMADCLFVAVDSDERVAQMKGPGRPVVCQEQRLLAVSLLSFVAYATLFNSDGELRHLIEQWHPDVLSVGEEYQAKTVIGRELVEANGGRVAFTKRHPGISTTEIIKRILEPFTTA